MRPPNNFCGDQIRDIVVPANNWKIYDLCDLALRVFHQYYVREKIPLPIIFNIIDINWGRQIFSVVATNWKSKDLCNGCASIHCNAMLFPVSHKNLITCATSQVDESLAFNFWGPPLLTVFETIHSPWSSQKSVVQLRSTPSKSLNLGGRKVAHRPISWLVLGFFEL